MCVWPTVCVFACIFYPSKVSVLVTAHLIGRGAPTHEAGVPELSVQDGQLPNAAPRPLPLQTAGRSVHLEEGDGGAG